MAVTFEAEPLRCESAFDSSSLCSQTQGSFISCTHLFYLLERARMSLHINIILDCATVFILFYRTRQFVQKINGEFYFESEKIQLYNSWILEILWKKYPRKSYYVIIIDSDYRQYLILWKTKSINFIFKKYHSEIFKHTTRQIT